MGEPDSDEGVARQPKQKRALERFERALDEAEVVLAESGLEGFSIPVISERLGYTRGSLYVYFPTPEALLNELAQRHLAKLTRALAKQRKTAALPWRRGIEAGVEIVSDYYDSHPVARLVILAGAVTDFGLRAQARMIKQLASAGRALWRQRGFVIPAEDPDVAALAVDLGVACLRRSVLEHGEIRPAYRRAAAQAMIDFLEHHVDTLPP